MGGSSEARARFAEQDALAHLRELAKGIPEARSEALFEVEAPVDLHAAPGADSEDSEDENDSASQREANSDLSELSAQSEQPFKSEAGGGVTTKEFRVQAGADKELGSNQLVLDFEKLRHDLEGDDSDSRVQSSGESQSEGWILQESDSEADVESDEKGDLKLFEEDDPASDLASETRPHSPFRREPALDEDALLRSSAKARPEIDARVPREEFGAQK